MTLASLVGPVASAMGVLMALSPLLQARRVQLAGDSSEVSSGVFLMMRVNASAWLLYGLASSNLILVVPNVFALTTTTFTLWAIRRNRGVRTTTASASAPAAAWTAHPSHAARVRMTPASVVRAGGRGMRLVRR